MKRQKLFPLIPLVVLLFSFTVNLSAQDARVFTNKAGIEIAATLIEVVGSSDIRIKRSSDGKEFLLKIVSLSLSDQQYIASHLKKRGPIAPQTLMISVASSQDRFAPVTDNSIWYVPYISGAMGRMAIPIGTWVSYNPAEISGRFLIPYYGEKHWKVEVADDRTIWLSRDNREKELIGLSLPEHEPEDDSPVRKALQSLDLSKVKHVLSVSCHNSSNVDMLRTLSAKLPLAVTMNSRLTSEQVDLLSRMNLIAIRTFQDVKLVPELARLKSLKFLWIGVDGMGQEGSITFPKMPGLEHFVVYNQAERVEWDETLKNFPNLRSLTTIHTHKNYEMIGNRGGRGNAPIKVTGSPITTLANNPKLNFLVIGAREKAHYISPKVLTTAPNLKYFRTNGGMIFEEEDEFEALKSLKKLQYIYLWVTSLSSQVMDEWFESGALAQLRDFSGHYVPHFEHCPKLEAISVFQSKETTVEVERFGEAPPSLKYIDLHRFSGDGVDSVNVPAPELIECLTVTRSGVDEPASLYRFKNLKRFSLTQNVGWMAAIDLNRFPLLETVTISQSKDIQSIAGISSHPSLEVFYFGHLPNFESLGEMAPNNTVTSVTLGYLPKLKSLASFDQFTGCSRLTILNCDALESYDTFKKNNDLSLISVKDCDKLPDYTRIPFH